MSNTWLGKNAVLWALDEAPGLPANLVATLIALARYADQDGRGAHPSAATIAAHIRKTERQAKRDLADLAQLGLIRRGNQRIVTGIRKDRRPVVYDLAMPPRGDTHDTPPTHNGVTSKAARGDIQGHHGVSPMSPKEIRNTSGIGASRDRAESAGTNARPPRRIWPCPGCGEGFNREDLTSEEDQRQAEEGDLWHAECSKAYEASERQDDPGHVSEVIARLRRELTGGRKPGTCTNSDMQDVTRELTAIDAALDAFVLDGTPLA